MSGFKLVEHTIVTAVNNGGTFAIAYPDGTDSGFFENAKNHRIVTEQNDVYYFPADFTLTFGTSGITVNWGNARQLAAGTKLYVELDKVGANGRNAVATVDYERAPEASLRVIELGAPDAADTDNIIKAATSTELPNAETVTYTPDTNGTSPTDGVGPVVTINGVKYWAMDVPRNVSLAVTHASSIVAMTADITGLDEFGVEMVEQLSITDTGTTKTANGKKAFKYIRSVAFTSAGNAEANTANLGFGDVLGLPAFLPDTGYVLKELEDGAAASAGTIVAGDVTEPSATTGDVRGTYDPSSACDGSKAFKLIVALPDPADRGLAQYSA